MVLEEYINKEEYNLFLNIKRMYLEDQDLNNIYEIETFLEKFPNIKILSISTMRPHVILDILECLPSMNKVKEITLSVENLTAEDEDIIFQKILREAQSLEQINVPEKYINKAKQYFSFKAKNINT